MAERGAALHRVFRPLRDVERVRRHDARDDAPDLALVVDDEVLRVLRLDDARHLPHAVVAPLLRVVLELLVAMAREVVHVLHDHLGLGEDVLVHALEDYLRLGERIAVDREERVVDVAVAKRLQRDETALDVELVDKDREFHCSVFLGCLRFFRSQGENYTKKSAACGISKRDPLVYRPKLLGAGSGGRCGRGRWVR